MDQISQKLDKLADMLKYIDKSVADEHMLIIKEAYTPGLFHDDAIAEHDFIIQLDDIIDMTAKIIKQKYFV